MDAPWCYATIPAHLRYDTVFNNWNNDRIITIIIKIEGEKIRSTWCDAHLRLWALHTYLSGKVAQKHIKSIIVLPLWTTTQCQAMAPSLLRDIARRSSWKKKTNIETKLDESNHVNSEYNMQFEIVGIALDHVCPIRMLPHTKSEPTKRASQWCFSWRRTNATEWKGPTAKSFRFS